MIPNVSSVFGNWTVPVQLRVVSKSAVDFELRETAQQALPFEAVMSPMDPQKVRRLAEGLRQWKMWDMWAETDVAPDSVLQDQDGKQFRVQEKTDWSQAGYFHYAMSEQPANSVNPVTGEVS